MVENSITEKKISEMMSGTYLMLRASIVLGMVAAVVTIIYFTPYPDQNFKSCDRPCHTLDWPMICRIKLYIEFLPSNILCQDCDHNSSCQNSVCDNNENQKGIILANRQFPAPSIQVCHNDILVVDIINNIPGYGLTMHWRGQPNNEAPFMDGVPMITQCAIPSFTTFQYKFRASSPGTHFYHAFSDRDRNKGLFGALVVREADKEDSHRDLYDEDLKEHVIMLSEWTNVEGNGGNILINGKGPPNSEKMEIFHVRQGRRYRFRLAYASGILTCPITLTIEDHSLKIISLDGNPIKPYETSSVSLVKGERLDFIIEAMEKPRSYLLRVESQCQTVSATGTALISYDRSTVIPYEDLLLEKADNQIGTKLEPKGSNQDVMQLLKDLESPLQTDAADQKFYLGYDFKYYEDISIVGMKNSRFKIYRINNITFTFPPSPLLTQPDEVPVNLMCNDENVPKRCTGKSICECVHIKHVPLGSTVEIILFDQGSDQNEHVFHLHGNHFYVVGRKTFSSRLSKMEVVKMDSENRLVERNLKNPIMKDTVRIPKNGLVVLRFTASNAGFWMLRDEHSRGWSRGLDVVFQVGGIANLVSTPTGFPTCGNFIGPDFFLL